MPFISESIPDLLGGVSQLAPQRRQVNEVESMVNCQLRPAEGVVKRPPTKWIAEIASSATAYDGAFVHTINKNASERFWVIVLDGDLKVFNAVDGTEVPVTFPDGKTYLDVVASPNEAFRLATFNQTTVIVNRETEVARASELSASRGHEALVVVQQTDYDTEYYIGIGFDGPPEFNEAGVNIGPTVTPISVRIPPAGEGSEDGDLPSLSTLSLALKLAVEIDLAYGSLATFLTGSKNLITAKVFGSTIHLSPGPDLVAGAQFWVSTRDDLANQGLQKVQEAVQSIDDLPSEAPVGFRIKVEGDPEKSLDDVFYAFTENNTWRETNQSGIPIALDPTTLPLELVHNPDLLADQFPAQVPTAAYIADGPAVYTTPYLETEDGAASTQEQLIISPAPGVTVDKFLNLADANGSRIDMKLQFNLDQTHIVGPGIDPTDPASSYAGDVHTIEVAGDTGSGYSTAYIFQVPAYHTPRKFEINLNFGGAAFDADENVRLRVISAGTNLGSLTLTANGLTVAYEQVETQRISIRSSHYAPGTDMTFTLNGTAFSHDFAAGGTQAAYGAALVTAIEAYGGSAVTATYNSDGFVTIVNDDGSTPTLILFTFDDNLDLTIEYFNGGADFVTLGVSVSDTIKNLTDVSEAIISAVAATLITSASLAGGTANAWADGDKGSAETAALSFACRQPTWAKRLVGTEETNKWPSFEGETINEVSFLKNRLVLISDENVAMSEVDKFFNFFRSSTLDVLDSDRIDVALSGNKTSSLHSAFTWNETLLTWSELGQFVVNGEPFLSPNTVKREATTAYVNTRKVKPVTSERAVYFLTEGVEFCQLWDYRPTSEDALSAEGNRISAQVPRYMPGTPRGLLAVSDPEVVLVLTATDPEKLYVYSHMTQDQKRVLSGWHEWSFSGVTQILGIGSIDNEVSLVVERDDGAVHLEVLDLWELSETTLDSQEDSDDMGTPPEYNPSPLVTRTEDTFTEAANAKMTDHTPAPTTVGGWLVDATYDRVGPSAQEFWIDGTNDRIRANDIVAGSIPHPKIDWADTYLAGGGSDLEIWVDWSWSGHQNVQGELIAHSAGLAAGREAGLVLFLKTLGATTVSIKVKAIDGTGATNTVEFPTTDAVSGVITVSASRSHAGGDITAQERYGMRVVDDVLTVFVADAITGDNEVTLYTGTLVAAWKTKFRGSTFNWHGLRPDATLFQTCQMDNFHYASGAATPGTTYTTPLGDSAYPILIGIEPDGTETTLTNNGDGTVTFPTDDKTGVNVTVGIPVASSIILSRFFHRKNFGPFAGDAEVRGHTYINNLLIGLEDTSTMAIAIAITGHVTFSQDLTELRSLDGEFMHVRVGGRNTETTLTLTSSDATNFKLVGIDWEGVYYNRTRRMS